MIAARRARLVGVVAAVVLATTVPLTLLLGRQLRQTRLDHQLVVAVAQQNVAQTERLLNQGADANVSARDEEWNTLKGNPSYLPLPRFPSVESRLVHVWQVVRGKHDVPALIIAVGSPDARLASALLARGADVNVGRQNGWTPLMAAVLVGKPETVRLLVRAGADVNARSGSGSMDASPLFLCLLRRERHTTKSGARAAKDRAEVMRFLLKAGVDVNAKGFRGETVLQRLQVRSVPYGPDDAKIERLLLASGAKP